MITYSTNWMGPINLYWYEERGLLEADGVTPKIQYSAGRIDIRDDSKPGYDGWNEYSVAPMHGEDWNALSDFLWDFESEALIPYDELIELFEAEYGKKIRWDEVERLQTKKKQIHDELYDKVKMEMFKASSKLEGIDYE